MNNSAALLNGIAYLLLPIVKYSFNFIVVLLFFLKLFQIIAYYDTLQNDDNVTFSSNLLTEVNFRAISIVRTIIRFIPNHNSIYQRSFALKKKKMFHCINYGLKFSAWWRFFV
jgi:hypothetical protein